MFSNKTLISLMFLVFLSVPVFAIKSRQGFSADIDFVSYQSQVSEGVKPFSKVSFLELVNFNNNLKCKFELAQRYENIYSSKIWYNYSEVELGDFFCNTRMGNLNLKLGSQNLDWNQNVGPQITDVFQAYDYRPSLFVGEKTKYSQNLLKADYFFEDSTLTVFVGVAPKFNQYVIQSAVPLVEKKSTMQDLEFGARFNKEIFSTDISLSVLNIYDRDFQILLQTTGFNLKHEVYKVATFGLTHEFFGGVVRLDYQAQQDRMLADRLFISHLTQQQTYTIGIDSPTFLDTIWGIQYSSQTITNLNFTPFRSTEGNYLTLSATNNDLLKFESEFIYFSNLKDNSSALKLNLKKSVNSRFKYQFGFESYQGDSNKSFGPYIDSSKILFGVLAKL